MMQGSTPVLVDFFAEWCQPCKIQSPVLQEIARELGDKLKVIKVDVDKNTLLAKRFQVRSVPTLILFRNGKSMWRQSGVLSKPQLHKVLLQYS